MIGTSTWDYVMIKFFILSLSSVVPLSVSYCVYRAVGLALHKPLTHLPLPLELWAAAETLFFGLVYLPRRWYLQRPAAHPPPPPAAEREELSRLCTESIQDGDAYLSKWFLGAPRAAIKRENVKEFFRWAFLNADSSEGAEDDEELEKLVGQMDGKLESPLEPGRGEARCLRLTLDEVHMLPRSIVWLLCVFFVDNLTYFALMYCGFYHHRTPLTSSFSILPPRPQTLLARHVSPSSTISYWHRPHTSKTRLPVLFIHGIGIGLYPYVPFLTRLNAAHPEEEGEPGIIALEIMPVSFRMTGPVLEKEVMCRHVYSIMLKHGWDRFVLVTHSYGSIIATHLLKDPSVGPSIASLVLVDPVSILLHLPDVAYNFTRRRPRRANEHQLHYFATCDPDVSRTLARHFFWADNILWKHQLRQLAGPAAVFLAGRDLIVDTPRVRAYLEDTAGWEDARCGGGREVDVRWCEELDHAQVFDSRSRLVELVSVIRDYARVAIG
ncbi:MAG: hypothetical protein M1832_001019 [Thelocarpon impressellum]|nr:MAG: hypothetical protein M1832_001019 [Thelocarpon impressellum]